MGSSPMVVRGIRESKDLDIVVSPELFEKCKQEGREEMPRTYVSKLGNFYLKQGDVELYLDVNCGDFNPTLKDLIQRSDTIEGFSFACLQDVISFKKAYNKPKHLEDIKKIEEYVKNKK